MRALQMHYTSCRMGRARITGLQIRTYTDGLDQDDREELAQLGAYRAPMDAPTQPSELELATVFPRAFRFARLRSGRYAVVRSCHAGQDYSLRGGNYFAHSLVFPRLPANRWPIDLYEWSGWKSRLHPDEDTEDVPDLLPSVDVGDIPTAASFSFDELQGFLEGEEGRPPLLVSMIRAVFAFHGAETEKPVVVRDTSLNGLFWMACIQKAFPGHLVADLTFSTYQFDPRRSLSINATCGVTEFLFNERERRQQFRQFDLLEAKHSDRLEASGDYAEIVARWMVEQPAVMPRLHEFTALFTIDRLDPALIHPVTLFRAAMGADPTPTARELMDAVQFAERFVTDEGLPRVLNLLADLPSPSVQGLGMEDRLTILRFLGKGSARTGDPRHRQAACTAWTEAFDQQVFGREADHGAILAAKDDLEIALGEHRSLLAETMLADDHLLIYREALPDLAPATVQEIIGALASALRELSREPVWSQPEVAPFIRYLVFETTGEPSGLERSLRAVGDDAATISGICLDIARYWDGSRDKEAAETRKVEAGRSLARVLRHAQPRTSAEVRKRLDTPGAWGLLLGEWLAMVDLAADKSALYRKYNADMKQHASQFAKACTSEVAQGLFHSLDEHEKRQQARTWLDDGTLDGFTGSLALECATHASKSIGFDLADAASSRAAESTRSILDKHGSPQGFHAVSLRRFVDGLVAPESIVAPTGELPAAETRDADSLNRALEGVDPATYDRFLEGALAAVLKTATDPSSHGALLSSLQIGHRDALESRYIALLSGGPPGRISASQLNALAFWLAFDPSATGNEPLAWMEQSAVEALLERIVLLEAESRAKLEQTVLRRIAGDEDAKLRWMRLLERAGRRPPPRKKGFLGRLFGRGSSSGERG